MLKNASGAQQNSAATVLPVVLSKDLVLRYISLGSTLLAAVSGLVSVIMKLKNSKNLSEALKNPVHIMEIINLIAMFVVTALSISIHLSTLYKDYSERKNQIAQEVLAKGEKLQENPEAITEATEVQDEVKLNPEVITEASGIVDGEISTGPEAITEATEVQDEVKLNPEVITEASGIVDGEISTGPEAITEATEVQDEVKLNPEVITEASGIVDGEISTGPEAITEATEVQDEVKLNPEVITEASGIVDGEISTGPEAITEQDRIDETEEAQEQRRQFLSNAYGLLVSLYSFTLELEGLSKIDDKKLKQSNQDDERRASMKQSLSSLRSSYLASGKTEIKNFLAEISANISEIDFGNNSLQNVATELAKNPAVLLMILEQTRFLSQEAVVNLHKVVCDLLPRLGQEGYNFSSAAQVLHDARELRSRQHSLLARNENIGVLYNKAAAEDKSGEISHPRYGAEMEELINGFDLTAKIAQIGKENAAFPYNAEELTVIHSLLERTKAAKGKVTIADPEIIKLLGNNSKRTGSALNFTNLVKHLVSRRSNKADSKADSKAPTKTGETESAVSVDTQGDREIVSKATPDSTIDTSGYEESIKLVPLSNSAPISLAI
ncbi:hypothetical protein NHE_0470 [Neorickettsia helminthoeca str. Oregon]|uniref:Uncharacterized protein n=1 Tax=Neorickettsia helminthoeca str. Oregon TaxID=1286528 RepID=X5GWI5_9RICK|nr:hypothetical protein [Neorickettsia helminthoeca]AHX11412.1 hypothetical protein NHE_0470 [Neorickettsia helminthoeca str. Oregon]